MLQPRLATKPDTKEKEEAVPFLNTLIVKAPKAEPLKIGDRAKLEGTIGDSSSKQVWIAGVGLGSASLIGMVAASVCSRVKKTLTLRRWRIANPAELDGGWQATRE